MKLIRKKVCVEKSIKKETYWNKKNEWGIFGINKYNTIYLCPHKTFKNFKQAKTYLEQESKNLRVGKYTILQLRNISEIQNVITNKKDITKRNYALIEYNRYSDEHIYLGTMKAYDIKQVRDITKFRYKIIPLNTENRIPLNKWKTLRNLTENPNRIDENSKIRKTKLSEIQPTKEELVSEAL